MTNSISKKKCELYEKSGRLQKKWKKLFQGKPVSRPNTVSSELTEARGLSGQLQNISFLLKLRDLCRVLIKTAVKVSSA